MTYQRVISRNNLVGDYQYDPEKRNSAICGDLRRLESDAVDFGVLTEMIARDAGVEAKTVVAVLEAFFVL